ncbi:NAD(+) synthase [Methanobrevibacter olleyae]|uniref:NAD(+) synthase n=1 Tax=Methanobrevibacter olleyae TaxID=294671 RepID=UPI000942AA6B|nr:NAD(+) synthase [Methanobrevibacter olleyae]
MNNFNALEVKNQCVKWIQDFFEENGKGCNAIVGVSGGKDSSVVAALCVEALGRERVIGVLMPNDIQSDIDCAKLLVNHLDIKHFTINIKDSVNGVLDQLSLSGIEISEQTRINLPARIRMSTLYAISQSNNGRVANTCNLSEDWIGYATRYGDGAGDFSPLAKLTVREVKEIGRSLNLPKELVDKVPLDGLSNQSDEEKLGFTYDVLDKYIRTGEVSDKKIKERIDYLHNLNKFKLEPMPSFEYK